MDRARKEELVASMHQTFQKASTVIVTHYSGLSVTEMEQIRNNAREAGAQFKVTKNRLIKLALKGTKYEGISDLFHGPTAIAYSDDPVIAAKVTVKFSEENEKLVVIGGAVGDKALEKSDIKSLASMLSLDELRGKIVGILNAPGSKLVGVLNTPAREVIGIIEARNQQLNAKQH
ncbi:MAG: 50S ribosomal protein L10 [Alphaproteobacteria bacterium MarineAlpha3_Bin5]|nr:MAG: 50S ribosomal protein L10 [Alphaproteobacteria bacterium MarineAlpha3_Bin5]